MGVGVDAVDVARFRKVLERRPSFATRCFTDSERADAAGSRRRGPEPGGALRRQGGGHEGARDRHRRLRVDRRRGVPRHRARAPRATRRTCGCTARPPSWPARRARAPSTSPSPTPTAWRSPSSWRNRPRARRPDPRRNAGGRRRRAGRRSRTRRWWTAPARPRPTPRSACSAAPTAAAWWCVAGKGSNGADGRVAAAFLAGRGARVRVVEAADIGGGDALPPCDLVIDAAYGTGFRGSYDAPARAAGRGGPGHRHPLGGRRRQRRRAGRRRAGAIAP